MSEYPDLYTSKRQQEICIAQQSALGFFSLLKNDSFSERYVHESKCTSQWMPIQTIYHKKWLSGYDYNEVEVIFCDKDSSFSGLVQAGSKPEAFITFDAGRRIPTHWMPLPRPPKD